MRCHNYSIILKKTFDGGIPSSKHLASVNSDKIILFGNISVLSKLGKIGTWLLGICCHRLALYSEVIQHHPVKVGRRQNN